MRSKHVCTIMSLIFALATLVGSRAAIAADKIPVDRMLPADVYAFIGVPSVPELKKHFNESSMGELRDDPELAEFWDDVKAQIGELSRQMEQRTGVKLEQLLEVPQGEIAVAYSGSKGLIVLLDFGDNRETVDKLLDVASEALADQDAKKSTEEIEDTTVTVYEIPRDAGDDEDDDDAEPDDAAPGQPPQKVAYFIKGSYLVAGTSVPALESVLVRWDGSSDDVFANNEQYSYVMERTGDGGTSQIVWYVNPMQLVQLGMQAIAESNPQAAMQIGLFAGFMEPLGVTGLRALGGSINLATEEFDSVSRTFVSVDFPTKGLINVFQFPATEQSPPDWVSGDSSSYFQVNWDVEKAYGAAEGMFDMFQGPGAFAQFLDDLADPDTGMPFHIKKDVIDQLTGTIHVVSDVVEQGDTVTGQFVAALEVRDPDKVKTTLANISKHPNYPLEARDFRGETIYEMETPQIPLQGVQPPSNQPQTVGIGVSRGHLMFANDVRALESAIRGDSDQGSLAESTDYRRVASHFPSETSFIGYQKQDAQVKTIYEMLRSGQSPISMEGIDFTKLPPFEAVQKYLPPTGSYAVPDDRGALIVSFSLPPEE